MKRTGQIRAWQCAAQSAGVPGWPAGPLAVEHFLSVELKVLPSGTQAQNCQLQLTFSSIDRALPIADASEPTFSVDKHAHSSNLQITAPADAACALEGLPIGSSNSQGHEVQAAHGGCHTPCVVPRAPGSHCQPLPAQVLHWQCICASQKP
jgi:hypothetical protein